MKTKSYWLLLPIALVVGYWAATAGRTDVVRPHIQYEARLPMYSVLERVENRIRDIARTRQLELFEKDRDQMAFLTEGNPALFVALYFHEEPILIVTNAGIGHKIVVTATDYRAMPLTELENLTQDLIKELEALGLEFQRVGESRQPLLP